MTDSTSKILEPDALVKSLAGARSAGKRIVMSNGCFDILHAGHLATLAAAARLGDILAVAINDDESVKAHKGAKRPIIALRHRMAMLAGLECVDHVSYFSGNDASELVREIAPDVYVKGGDWASSATAVTKLVKEQGGQVVYQESVPGISTTDIIDRVLKAYQ